jgi:hypothetical protein
MSSGLRASGNDMEFAKPQELKTDTQFARVDFPTLIMRIMVVSLL